MGRRLTQLPVRRRRLRMVRWSGSVLVDYQILNDHISAIKGCEVKV